MEQVNKSIDHTISQANAKASTIVNDGSMYRYWLDDANNLWFTVMHQLGSKDGRTSKAQFASRNAQRAAKALLKNPNITHVVIENIELKNTNVAVNNDDRAEALADLKKRATQYANWRDLCDTAGPHHAEHDHYTTMSQTTAIRSANQLRFCIEQGYL